MNVLKGIGIHMSKITRRKNVFFSINWGGWGGRPVMENSITFNVFFIEDFPNL